MNDPKDIEALAALEHTSWSNWTVYMIERLRSQIELDMGADAKSQFDRLPAIQRWRRQIATPYDDLDDREKESDREVVRKKIDSYRGPTQLYRASVELVVWGGPQPDEPRLLTVTNRRFGGFSLPGGKVEQGESLLDAAKRELREETGCKPVSIEPFIGGVRDPSDRGFPWFCMTYFVDIGDQVPSQQEEGTEIAWHTPAQVVKDSIFPDWYRYLFGQM